jgi:hypothetical protein
MMTKNRIANSAATLAAVVGLVLVVTGAGQKDDDSSPSPAPPSQVAPAQPGQSPPGESPNLGPVHPRTQPSTVPPSRPDGDTDDDG